MKKILTIAVVVALGTVASYSQGLVSIATASFLVSTNTGPTGVPANTVGKAYGTGAAGFYYELLISANTTTLASSANDITKASNLALWSDSGVTGASQSALNAGKISSTSTVATGWTAPTVSYDNAFSYIVVGWSGNYGTTYSAFLSALGQAGGLAAGGYFGSTAVSVNVAGGGNSSLPSVNLWGNQTGTSGYGIASALVLNQVVSIPEPTTLALAGLSGASLLLFRRRK